MRKAAVDYRRLAAADYSDLSLSVDALGTDFRALHAELLHFGGYRSGTGVRKVPAAQLTAQWLQQNGSFRPVLVPASPTAAQELGVGLPEGNPTVDRLASKIGLPFEVRTTDVQTQGEGPRWTLHQWCLYWEARRAASREPPTALATAAGAAGTAPAGGSAAAGTAGEAGAAQRPRRPAEDEADSAAVKRKRSAEEEAAAQQLKGISAESKKRLLEVAALPLTGTPLEAEVSPPAAVQGVDLAQQVMPRGAPSRPAATVNLVMSPEGAYSDFHLAPGGASVWLHCLSGRRVLALVPPTPRNLATYAAWAASAKHAGVFLPQHCEGVVRAEVGPGDTLIIPGGWAHAAATTSSALLLGGSFLRRDALAMQLEAWRIEDHLGVRPRFRYPAFKQVMWLTAAASARRLRRLAGLSPAQLQERAAAQLAEWAAEEEREAAARAQAGGAASAGSDSVSKAGAAKRHKGWQAGDKEVADDAATGSKRPRAGAAAPAGGSAGAKPLQASGAARSRPTSSPAAVAGLRAAASPPAARQVGRAVGGGSRLRRSSSGGGVGRAAPRMNPTQLGIDLHGGGGGGGGGSRRHRQRQHSPDSFIEKGGDDESDGGVEEEDEDAAEWAPAAAAAAAGSEDEEVSDDSVDEGLDLAELAAAGEQRRAAGAVVMEIGEDGEARPRRLTARQAARQAATAAAWDGRIAARQARAAAGDGGWSAADEEELDEEGVDGWGGGGGSRRGRQATRFGGRLPPRLAAMLQEEEEEEEVGEQQLGAAAPAGAAGGVPEAAIAAFAAAEQQQKAAGLKPVKIRLKAALGASPAGEQPAPAMPRQEAQQQAAASAQKLKIKIKPTGGDAAQQAQQAQQQPTIPQVDGAVDDVAAMYDALYDDQQPQEQQQQQSAPAAQQLPPVLTAPLGQAGQPRAGAAPATSEQQHSQHSQQQQEEQQQEEQQQQCAGSAGNAAEQAAPVAGLPRSPSRHLSDSSQGQLAGAGPEESDSVRPNHAGGLPSGSVEGPSPHTAGQSLAEAPTAEQGMTASPARKQHTAVQQLQLQGDADVVFGQHEPGASSGQAAPQQQQQAAAAAAPAAAGTQEAQQPVAGAGGPGSAGVEEASGEDEDEGDGGQPAEALSLEEEEGLAALLAALKQWLRAPHALNDVPLSITSPKAVVARLEVCMRALGLSLTPPQPADLESVPLERLLPVRTPRAAGTLQRSLQTPQTLGGSEFVPGELDAVGEVEEGGEFDPADLLEEGAAGGGVVVEESAGPKRKPAVPAAAKLGVAHAGGSAGRAPAPQPAKRKAMSVKDRLKKKLKI